MPLGNVEAVEEAIADSPVMPASASNGRNSAAKRFHGGTKTGSAPGPNSAFSPAWPAARSAATAAAGLVPSGFLLVTLPVGATAAVVLGGFAAIFAVFGLRTALRHGTSLEMTGTELRARGPWHSTIEWAKLDRMRLAYYSVRRDRRSGWMQLDLGGGGARLRLDSRIDGFDQVVRHAAIVAAARGLELNEATAANLQALGIRLPDSGAE